MKPGVWRALSPIALVAACTTSSGENAELSSELGGVYRSSLVDQPCPNEDSDASSARRSIAHVRALAGLPMLRCDARASTAARAHCAYVAANGGALTHVQQRGRKGFTGATFEDRLAAVSFADEPAGEVLATLTGADAIVGPQGYLNSVYHRSFFLRSETLSFGYGATAACSTVEFGRAADARTVRDIPILWPPDGARGVPHLFYASRETPNPVPGSVVVGTPVSLIRVAKINNFTATLTGPSGLVPTTTLTSVNDKNKLVRQGEIHMIPLAPLTPSTIYRARFELGGGTIIESTFTTTDSAM